jgi:hypothetical protein
MRRWYLVVGSIVAACWLLPGSAAALPPSSPEIAMTLFVTPDGGGNCSAGSPCSLQTALIHVPSGGKVYAGQGTYTARGEAVAVITKSLTLYGGWDSSSPATVVRDPVVFPSILDGEWARRGVSISGPISATVDGFTITGGNATGLGGCGFTNPAGCGGGVLVSEAGAIIANNIITGNVAAITLTAGLSVYGVGGGVALMNTTGTVVTGNVIVSNAASLMDFGRGGGIYMEFGSGAQVLNNRVISNVASASGAGNEHPQGDGGGIYAFSTYSGALIQGNTVAGNRDAESTAFGGTGGLFLAWGSCSYLDNLVQDNHGWFAMRTFGGSARLERNRLVGNHTIEAIHMDGAPADLPPLVNNVVADSGSAFVAYGFQPSTIMTATLLHNTLAGSGSGTSVYAFLANVYLTNTIVAGFAEAITLSDQFPSRIVADHSLFWGNAVTGTMGTDPVTGDPAFVNPAGGDFHIGPASAAINQGSWSAVVTDMDGEPRWVLPDIGADEYWAPGGPRRVFLPLVARN